MFKKQLKLSEIRNIPDIRSKYEKKQRFGTFSVKFSNDFAEIKDIGKGLRQFPSGGQKQPRKNGFDGIRAVCCPDEGMPGKLWRAQRWRK